MKKYTPAHNTKGFTIIELVLVIVIVLILAVIFAASYNGIRTRERDSERRSEVTLIQSKLETYYAKFSRYPTLDEINNEKWRTENLKDLSDDQVADPLVVTENSITNFVAKPAKNVYSYEVSGTDGKDCDNTDKLCTQYTLTATYENGTTFSKSNIN